MLRRVCVYALIGGALTVQVTTAAPAARQVGRGTLVTVTPVRPWQPGDKVWTATPSPSGFAINATGCQRVPSTGYISHGVYAQTAVEYSNYWDWSASSSGESFSWYVKTGSGTIDSHGTSGGGAGASSVPANNHYWQVQNTGADPQAWTACFDVR